jgi:hypothetical protein
VPKNASFSDRKTAVFPPVFLEENAPRAGRAAAIALPDRKRRTPETHRHDRPRLIYAALLIVGTFLPWSYFYAWFAENGWSLSAMIDAWYVNDATSGLVYDLTIAALALTVWALWEGLARRDRWFLAVIPATYAIGVSAGLPLALPLHVLTDVSPSSGIWTR